MTRLKSSLFSSGQSVIGDLTDFRYLAKDILSSGQSVIGMPLYRRNIVQNGKFCIAKNKCIMYEIQD
jgi:hypothetical protein